MTIVYSHIKYWGVRLMAILTIAFFIYLIYFFKISEVTLFNTHFVNPFYALTAPLEVWLYLLVYFIFVFVFNSIFLTGLTITYKIQNKKADKLKNVYEKHFAELVTKYLTAKAFKEKEGEKAALKLLKRAYNKRVKIILVEVLHRVHSQVVGDLRTDVNNLFKQLKLDRLMMAYLYSPYLSDKVLAIKTIADFQIHKKSNKLLKYTNSKNDILRAEAFISSIKLSMFDNITFKKRSRWNISKLDMNNILLVTNQFKNHNIDIKALISSEFPRVVAMGLLLANEHKKTELKELIKEKIGDSDPVVNQEAIQAFISMADRVSDYEFLLEGFDKHNQTNKMVIVLAFQKCPDIVMSKYFYTSIIDNEELMLKNEAMKRLLELDPNKCLLYKNSLDTSILKAYKQSIDIYIN